MQVFGICRSVCITKSSKNCFISFIVQAVFTSENSKEVIMYKRTIKMHCIWQYFIRFWIKYMSIIKYLWFIFKFNYAKIIFVRQTSVSDKIVRVRLWCLGKQNKLSTKELCRKAIFASVEKPMIFMDPLLELCLLYQ